MSKAIALESTIPKPFPFSLPLFNINHLISFYLYQTKQKLSNMRITPTLLYAVLAFTAASDAKLFGKDKREFGTSDEALKL